MILNKYPVSDAGDLLFTVKMMNSFFVVLCSRRVINRLIKVLAREHKIFNPD